MAAPPPASPQDWSGSQERPLKKLWSPAFIALIVTGSVGSLLILIVGLLSGPLGVASVLAALPTLAGVVLTFMFLDRLEPEPLSAQLWALTWGTTVAVSGSILLELVIAGAGNIGDYGTAVVVAPVVEEALKGVALYILWKYRVITGVLNAVVYGGLAAAGFAFIENIGYFLMTSTEDGGAALISVVVMRGVITPFAHPLFTAFTAFGVGYAIKHSRREVAVVGFLAAVAVHALWNHLASVAKDVGDLFSSLGLVMLPLFVLVVAFVLRLRTRERRQLQRAESMMYDVLPPSMAPLLWDRAARARFSRQWLASGGSKASLRLYVSSLTHLAMSRSERTSVSSANEDALKRTVQELSPWR
jgi:RsiW-degrading membrane proteinase PrsW (M82 family)